MTKDEKLKALRSKLAASEAMGVGYKDRIKAIAAEIKRLEDA